MHPLPHHYTTRLTAGTSEHARLSAPDRPHVVIAAPAEFGGPGDAWSPEHLLLGAVQACFLFTLRAVAGASSVPLLGVDAEAVGIVAREQGVTRFTDIIVRAVIRVPAGSDVGRVLKLVEKTERNCLVTASLSTPVRVQPEVCVVADAQPALGASPIG